MLLHKIGRFPVVRRAYSSVQAWIQRRKPDLYKQRLSICKESIFDSVAVGEKVQDLRRDGVGVGIQVPSPLVNEILQFASQTPCLQPGIDRAFIATAVRDGFTTDGDPVEHGFVTHLSECEPIQRIVRDPLLIQIARSYLNYWPNKIEPILTWSFSTERASAERSDLHIATRFHYDVEGYNFMAAFFLLTRTAAQSGAHVVIKGSHVNKPIWMLFHSGMQSEEAVRRYYRPEDELILCGDAGLGFVEDVSCIHRVIPASGADRLILSVRYS